MGPGSCVWCLVHGSSWGQEVVFGTWFMSCHGARKLYFDAWFMGPRIVFFYTVRGLSLAQEVIYLVHGLPWEQDTLTYEIQNSEDAKKRQMLPFVM